MRSGVPLGRIAGIEVVADASVLLLAALVAWALYLDVEATLPSSGGGAAAVAAVFGALLFVVGILVHELSHAFVARRRDVEVTGVRLFVFGGYTTMEGEPPRARDEFAIAAAGPAASFAVSAVLYLASLASTALPAMSRALLALAIANLALAAFNLLPGFPLDGGRVLRAVVWQRSGDRAKATQIAVRSGQVVGFGLMGVGVAFLVTTQDFAGFWWLLIGWFVYRTAADAGKRENVIGKIEGLTAADVMRSTPDAVPGDMPVGTVVDLYQIGRRLRSLPVEVDGRIRGVIGQRELDEVSPDVRATARAETVMTTIGPDDVVDAGTSLESLFAGPIGEAGCVVVVSEGRVVGVIENEDLAELLA